MESGGYDIKFKAMVINYSEKTNKDNAARKFSVREANAWIDKATKAGSEQQQLHKISFTGPKHGISMSLNMKSLSLCAWREKLLCQLYKQDNEMEFQFKCHVGDISKWCQVATTCDSKSQNNAQGANA